LGLVTVQAGYVHIASIELSRLPDYSHVRIRARGAYIDPSKAKVVVLDTHIFAQKNSRARTTKIHFVQFKPGDRFTVNITSKGWIGYYAKFQIYSRQRPKPVLVECIPEGTTVPAPCVTVDKGR
jgi:hypothetical protein